MFLNVAELTSKVLMENKLGFLSVTVPHFTSILQLERDVLRSSKYAKKFSGQAMTKYFELSGKKLNQDLLDKGRVDIQTQSEYQMDYGSCTLTCVHNKLKQKNIEIPGIV